MATVDATSVTSAASVRRLAELVRERMAQLGPMKQADVSAAGGPSPATLRGLFAAAEAGREFKDFQVETLRKFDRALQWEAGSTREVLAGGKPRLATSGGLTTFSTEDSEVGELVLTVPKEALEGMTPTEQAEAKAFLVAQFLAKYREFRAGHSRPE